MPRTSERGGPQTRARILQVSNRLFLERGYESVTVAEIAREAGVSSVTVFNHFARKEDLFLDRAADAAELLRTTVRDRAPGTDVLTALQQACSRLVDERHPLSGVADGSVPFFRTVAESPALIARARAIAAELQATLTGELDGDATLLAAFFIAGYSTVLVETARRRIDGEPADTVTTDHRARLDRLFTALREGIVPQR
ncbi:TetR/AcrR family transcriptional regulator [Actinoplanes couchii]|uniref:TetR family transcriptional regulator n=1 Tax=Actinoplanes couchii TaxID=403638 RepID=A0ABQ3XTY6_9ACTN|nr:TetR/AcrR family transcriptional regulator [Actinoplanes couchii]MDR6318995.1 AcrR family transcriptional regulator [Actinoplanes couchii]GID61979.1 TetR family transcriptional regulator [Actinoplanes couchii]